MRRLLAGGPWNNNQQNNVKQTAVHVAAHVEGICVIDYNDISKLHFYISLQLP